MYNPYITSTLSPRFKGSVSYSFNDYAYFPTEYRFDRHLTSLPSSSSSSCFCACCAASSVHRVSISPRFLYGLRQSSLIQWSASRRLILRGEDQYWFRIPVHDVGQNCCCGHVCHVRERGRKRGEGKFRRMVSEGKSERHCSFEYDDAEMMLSLLTEEVGEECYGAREKQYRVSRRVEVKKKGNIGDTSYKKKKNVGSGFLGSQAKCEFEYEKIKSTEEDNSTRNEDRRTAGEEMFLKGEKRRGRKPGSSCSSYYSCSSLGELESDNEVQARGEEDNEELSSRYRRDSQESIKVRDDAENVKVIKINENIIGAGKTFESDWRKKSEKKLNDASVELSESKEEALQNQRKLSEVHETGHHHQASSAHEKFDGIEEKSASWITESESRRQYSRKSDQVTGVSESRMKQKHFSGVQEISSSDVEAVSSSQKHFGKREENSNVAESLALDKRNEDAKTIGHISRKDDYRINAKQSDQVSQIQDMYVRRTNTSEKQSEARIENQVDRSSVVLSSIQDTEKYHHLTGQSEFRQTDSRRKSQQSAEISAKEQHVQSGHTAIRKKQSAKGSQEMSTISLRHSSDAQVTDIQRTSENRISSKETYSGSVLKSTEKTTKHHEISEDRVFQVGSRKETEGTSNRVSSSKTSLILESTPILHHDGLDMGDKSSSQAIVIGPTSEFPSTSLGTVSDALHTKVELNAPPVKHEMYKASTMIQTHEDLLSSISQVDKLGSAQRFQKSSTQIVGEFIEKATHEVSSSQSQEEGKTSEEEVLIKGHKNEQKSSSRSGYADIKLKEQDSRRSSRSSGVKGPSDEIWDVMGPSTQEFVDTQVPESSDPTENTVAKRTGRSLWNIFSDIVRLRWASHAKTRDSTAKSGGKSSPNQSTSSETWFSGHERDENSEENLKRENKSMSRQSIATPTGSQGEGYSSSSSKDKLGYVGLELPPSSSKTASVSEPKDSSSVSPEEDLKTIGAKVVESSVSLPSLRIRRYSSTDEVAESGKPDLSASGSLAGKEQLIGTRPINVPGSQGKDGELTRRKLQRTNQVMKDRFDEWEEAYMLESERRKIDEMFMKEALLEAKKAADIWEVPVGAVLVQHGKIIARGYNLVEELRDSTAHAEIICIREASNELRTWRLSETTLYVTLEPCPMCAGAILQARIDTVVWGAPNKLLGADGSWIRLFPSGGEGRNSSESTDKPPAPVHPFHPKIAIRRGVLGAECADVMQQFFQLRRRKKEKKQPDTPPTPSCLPISNHPTKIFSKMHDAFHFMFCL